MFSEQYIRDNFLDFNIKNLLNDDVENKSKDDVDTKSINENRNPELASGTIEVESLDQINNEITRNRNMDYEFRQSNGSLDYVSRYMASKLRVINGAVMFPGTYPLADRSRLKDLIDVAGVLNSKASSDIIVTKSIKENGSLVMSEPTIFKLDSLMMNETILSGEFYVTVPKVVNEAINGFINLSGEFMVPGNFLFPGKRHYKK